MFIVFVLALPLQAQPEVKFIDGDYYLQTIDVTEAGSETLSDSQTQVEVRGDRVYLAAPDRFESTASLTEDEIVSQILRTTNQQRRSHGLPELRLHSALQKAARSHAKEMRELNYFSHVSPTPGRSSTRSRVNLYGSSPRLVAENIFECNGYSDQLSAEFATEAFWKSAPHRQNILNPQATHIGIGFVSRNGWVSVSQVFGAGF